MIITDCIWEKNNLNVSTVEVLLETGDINDVSTIEDVMQHFDYVVVKVPMNMVANNIRLGELGFSLMEVQMNVSSKLAGYDWNRINLDIDEVKFDVVTNSIGLTEVLDQITDDMFTTDRITLDSYFGPRIGHRRYANWIISDYKNNKSKVAMVKYHNENVGFMMFRIEGGRFYLLLNGLFKKWQGRHLGVLTPSSPLIYSKYIPDIVEVKTSISSNNIPVVKLYNRLGYILDNQNYVFIKHTQSDCKKI